MLFLRHVSRRLLMAGLVAVGAAALLAPEASAQTRKNPFEDTKSWGYQLRNLGPVGRAKIAASPYDMVVIDDIQGPGAQGGDGKTRMLTKEEVDSMKRKPDGSRRLVIDYLSIGESEVYRYYWRPEWNRSRPSWMKKENKEWKGNYLVEYWNPTWQSIIFGSPEAYVDTVLAQGYDGFYFDRADAYYYFGDNKLARDRMVEFVTKLVKYVRSKKPDAAILVQNAEELLTYPEYVAAIDGIAKESPIYGIKGADVLNPQADIVETRDLLTKFQKQGKKVFVVEYLRKPDTIADAIKRTKDLDWILYMGPRGLAQLSGALPTGYSQEQVKATDAWAEKPAPSPVKGKK